MSQMPATQKAAAQLAIFANPDALETVREIMSSEDFSASDLDRIKVPRSRRPHVGNPHRRGVSRQPRDPGHHPAFQDRARLLAEQVQRRKLEAGLRQP